MSEELFDLDNLDDNVFGGDFAPADAATPDASTTPADEEAAEDDEEDVPEVDIPDPAPKDQGPGDLKVALQQARASEKAAKAQAQALQQQFQTLQAQFNQIQERDQQAAWRAQLEREVSELHPDDVPAYLQAKEQERLTALQAQVQQQQAQQALTLSEQYARAAFPDYDAQVAKVLSAFGPAVAQWALTQPNPAMAVYEKAKSFYTPQEVEALRAEDRKSWLAEQNARSAPTRPSPPPAPRLASLPAAAKASPSSDPLKGVKRGLASQVGSESWHAAVNELFERASG